MFSATRLIAAIAIVALGTGALFVAASPGPSPVPTAVSVSPSPTPSDDRLSQLITEEVEPGIVRIIDDGAGHALTGARWDSKRIAIGAGSVWLVDADRSGSLEMFRLGQEGATDASWIHPYWPDLTVAPDGTVWAVGEDGTGWGDGGRDRQLLSYRDGSWTSHPVPDRATVNGIEVGEDGAVLVNWFEADVSDPCGEAHGDANGPPMVGRLKDGEWETLPALPAEVTSAGDGGSLTVAPDGTVWLAIDFFNSCQAWAGLYRFDTQRWVAVPEVLSGEGVNVGRPTIGPDGTLWVYATGERAGLIAEGTPDLSGQGRTLSRLADGAWTTFDATDGVPVLHASQMYGPTMAVGLDGTLWLAFDGDMHATFDINHGAGVLDGPEDVGPCPGVLSFDGSAWRTHLGGSCANDLALAEDGSVWVTVAVDHGDADRAGLYRITPETGAGDAP